jgi:N-acetyl-anhydromuramyl-L-alanine amidase AmpD
LRRVARPTKCIVPWKTLAENGFESGQMKHCKPLLSLLMPNRDCESSATLKNLSAAIIAFKRHFIQTDVNDVLDQKTIKPFIPFTINNKQINKYRKPFQAMRRTVFLYKLPSN